MALNKPISISEIYVTLPNTTLFVSCCFEPTTDFPDAIIVTMRNTAFWKSCPLLPLHPPIGVDGMTCEETALKRAKRGDDVEPVREKV